MTLIVIFSLLGRGLWFISMSFKFVSVLGDVACYDNRFHAGEVMSNVDDITNVVAEFVWGLQHTTGLQHYGQSPAG